MDGLLIVDKPEGITSLGVVREVKRRLRAKKAGHIGTLDPFATGVLPVVINEATKLVPFLREEPKGYEGVLKLGEETTTDDVTGEVISRKAWDGEESTLTGVFQAFRGRIRQRPPMFSAVKVDGKPLYRLARKGIDIERKEREVEILDLDVVAIEAPQIRFRVSCSKGTYIRTLAKDIGRTLGCGAHLVSLRRVRSGSFTLAEAIPWESLRGLNRPEEIGPWLISLDEALSGLPEVVGNEVLTRKVRFGRDVVIGDLPLFPPLSVEKGEWFRMSSPKDGLVAILRSEIKGEDLQRARPETVAFRPLRVFQPNHRPDKVETVQ